MSLMVIVCDYVAPYKVSTPETHTHTQLSQAFKVQKASLWRETRGKNTFNNKESTE